MRLSLSSCFSLRLALVISSKSTRAARLSVSVLYKRGGARASCRARVSCSVGPCMDACKACYAARSMVLNEWVDRLKDLIIERDDMCACGLGVEEAYKSAMCVEHKDRRACSEVERLAFESALEECVRLVAESGGADRSINERNASVEEGERKRKVQARHSHLGVFPPERWDTLGAREIDNRDDEVCDNPHMTLKCVADQREDVRESWCSRSAMVLFIFSYSSVVVVSSQDLSFLGGVRCFISSARGTELERTLTGYVGSRRGGDVGTTTGVRLEAAKRNVVLSDDGRGQHCSVRGECEEDIESGMRKCQQVSTGENTIKINEEEVDSEVIERESRLLGVRICARALRWHSAQAPDVGCVSPPFEFRRQQRQMRPRVRAINSGHGVRETTRGRQGRGAANFARDVTVRAPEWIATRRRWCTGGNSEKSLEPKTGIEAGEIQRGISSNRWD
ncbi:hypothetical protein Tco_1236487 [Tanacetum coccineum]